MPTGRRKRRRDRPCGQSLRLSVQCLSGYLAGYRIATVKISIKAMLLRMEVTLGTRYMLEVGCVDLEVALRMLADRADLRGFLADDDVAAVAALPDHILVP